MSNFPERQCLECGDAYQPRHPAQLFCCAAHGKAFNNRRAVRGAEIYDLFCALRNDRPEAKRLGVWTEMCRLELNWRDDDQRAGRRTQSYLPPSMALRNLNYAGKRWNGETVAKPHRVGRA